MSLKLFKLNLLLILILFILVVLLIDENKIYLVIFLVFLSNYKLYKTSQDP